MPVPPNPPAPQCLYHAFVRRLWRMTAVTADALHDRNPTEYRRRYTIAKRVVFSVSFGIPLAQVRTKMHEEGCIVTEREYARIKRLLTYVAESEG